MLVIAYTEYFDFLIEWKIFWHWYRFTLTVEGVHNDSRHICFPFLFSVLAWSSDLARECYLVFGTFNHFCTEKDINNSFYAIEADLSYGICLFFAEWRDVTWLIHFMTERTPRLTYSSDQKTSVKAYFTYTVWKRNENMQYSIILKYVPT